MAASKSPAAPAASAVRLPAGRPAGTEEHRQQRLENPQVHGGSAQVKENLIRRLSCGSGVILLACLKPLESL